jgi:hypothetical protein
MPNLAALIAEAENADPRDRILYRDPIASHGLTAIPHIERWLRDPRLGALRGRVLERIADDRANRSAVLTAFASALTGELTSAVRNDVELAIDRLGWTRSRIDGARQPRTAVPAERLGSYWLTIRTYGPSG